MTVASRFVPTVRGRDTVRWGSSRTGSPVRASVAASLAAALTWSCGGGSDEGTPGSRVGAGETDETVECDWRSEASSDVAREPPCDLEFVEVVRLEGEIDGVSPREPVRVLRDGTYVTGTYFPGEVALWGPDGRLIDVIGRGPGEGPGEFGHPGDFAQTAEDEFLVFSGQRTVHAYSTKGEYRRSVTLPSGTAVGAAYGPTAVTRVRVEDGYEGLLISRDGVRSFGLLSERAGVGILLAAAVEVGVWSAESDRYLLRRHALPEGNVAASIQRKPDWLTGEGGAAGYWTWGLYGLHADSRGLVWTLIAVRDDDAPPGAVPYASDIVEQYVLDARYSDRIIEALTPDGDLVASAAFDGMLEAAMPIGRDLWFRRSTDLLPAVVVLEARLTSRRDD